MKIKTLAVSLISVLLICACNSGNEQKAKYIFLFIGDGMGNPHVDMTESYLSYKAGKLGGEQLTFTQFPYFGSVTNYSASNNITCSAAAGTAIATGYKTKNRCLGVDAEGNPHESIAENLKKEGYQVGIITSVNMNDATPGAFYAHVKSRDKAYEISKQIIPAGIDFIAGAGFKKYKNKKGEKIVDYLTENGMTVCYSQEEFKSAPKDSKIVMCQPYNKDVEPKTYVAGDIPPQGHMNLTDYITDALEKFDEEPFFIMCEGGEIDWAAHWNKTLPTIVSILAFDDAVKIAYDFYLKHPDETLIVVTADHETGGAVLGYGATHLYSVDWQPLDSAYTAEGYTNKRQKEENRKLNERARIAWTTEDHTGGNVPIYAIGKGAEKFSGRMDNTQIKEKILCMKPDGTTDK